MDDATTLPAATSVPKRSHGLGRAMLLGALAYGVARWLKARHASEGAPRAEAASTRAEPALELAGTETDARQVPDTAAPPEAAPPNDRPVIH